jgi:thiol:disulfide interchange protein
MPYLRRFAGLSFPVAIAVALATFPLEAGSLDPLCQQASAPAGPAVPPATVQIEAARIRALDESRNILVEFGASWCGWCRRFDTFLQSPDAGALMARQFVMVKLTVQESPDKRALNTLGAQALMDEWGGSDSGLPFYVFLDAKGGKIADSRAMPSGANIGYPATPFEIQSFARLLEKAAPRMTVAERARIARYFAAGR